MTLCQACDKPIALVNYDKLRGVIGLTQAWVHVDRRGRIKKRDHRPIPPEGTEDD